MNKRSTPIINHYISLITFKDVFPIDKNLDKFLKEIVGKLDLNVVKSISHKFEPIGITHLLILSQSHLAIHTFPENNAMHVDLVSSSELAFSKYKKVINEVFNDQINEIISKDCNI